jgi:hypothetical protein
MPDSPCLDFVVEKKDLRRTAFVAGAHSTDTVLEPGQVLLRIARFALTANNVTYGAVGDAFGYWRFFPGPEGFGRIPVWGFADVERSRCDGLAPGERIFGYWPISTHTVLVPERVSPAGFVEAAPHRAGLPPFYNQYSRVAADPGYDRSREPHLALFRPLFTTSFLIDDAFAERAWLGARSLVISSASSKTALGLAFLAAQAKRGLAEIVGLTSAGHRGFVSGTGYYDRVLSYDEIDALAPGTPSLFVDVAGNTRVLAAVHRRLGDGLRHSCRVGAAHWEARAPVEALPGPEPVLFFAPDQGSKRAAEWGAAGLQARVAGAMARFFDSSSRWLRIVEGRGPEAVEAAYRAYVDGKADPAEGHVLSL